MFNGFECSDEPGERVKRIHSSMGCTGVNAPPLDMHNEFGPASMPSPNLVAARLSDNHQLGLEAFPQHSRPEPPDLFLHNCRNTKISQWTLPFRKHRGYSMNLCSQRALDIHRTSSPNPSLRNGSGIGWIRPTPRITHIHMIEMGIEHDEGRLAFTSNPANHIADLITLHFVISQTDHLGENEFRERFLAPGKTLCLNQTL